MNLRRWLNAIEPTFRIPSNQLSQINQKLNHIIATMATSDEQAATENRLADRLEAATAVILADMKALKDAQSAGSTTPAEDAATARLEADVQALEGVGASNAPPAPVPAPAPSPEPAPAPAPAPAPEPPPVQ